MTEWLIFLCGFAVLWAMTVQVPVAEIFSRSLKAIFIESALLFYHAALSMFVFFIGVEIWADAGQTQDMAVCFFLLLSFVMAKYSGRSVFYAAILYSLITAIYFRYGEVFLITRFYVLAVVVAVWTVSAWFTTGLRHRLLFAKTPAFLQGFPILIISITLAGTAFFQLFRNLP